MPPIPPEQNSVHGELDSGAALLPARAVWERYNVTDRTLDRWLKAGIFPRPDRVINNRRYWRTATVESFDREAS